MFKPGDKVKCIKSPNGSLEYFGNIVTVKTVSTDGQIDDIEEWSHNGWIYSDHWFELINNSGSDAKKIMSMISKIKMDLKSEPEKSLIKSGIMKEDESLTSDGREILEMILVEKFKTELKDKADIILAEDK